MIKASKAGMSLQTLNNTWHTGKSIVETVPDAHYTQPPYIEGPFGKINFRDGGSFGMNIIPSSVPEEKMKKILEFLDYGASDEGYTLYMYGLADVHYTVVDGF